MAAIIPVIDFVPASRGRERADDAGLLDTGVPVGYPCPLTLASLSGNPDHHKCDLSRSHFVEKGREAARRRLPLWHARKFALDA